MKQLGIKHVNRDLLQYHVGLCQFLSSSYTPEAEKKYEETAQNIMKENPKLVSETKTYLQKTREAAKRIFDELDDFLKSNNLILEEEPVKVVSHF